MCAPMVIAATRRELSRRRFVATFGAALPVAQGFSPAISAQQKPAPTSAPTSVEKPARMRHGFRDVIDLTHPFSPAVPVYPAYKPVQVRQRFTIARDGFAANEVTFDEHTGTHVDPPVHFVADATPGDRLPPERLTAPLV